MKKDSTRFFTAIFVVFLMITIVDIAVGFVSDKVMEMLPNYSSQKLAKDNYRLHRLDTKIVILGSSRGSHHYVTRQLSDSINTFFGEDISIYNASIDGQFANSNSCAAETIVARYRPKLVIYDIPESQLASSSAADIEFSAPFYWNDSIVHRYLNNLGIKEKILMKSSLFRYNDKIFRIASSFLRPIEIDDGYLPLYGSTIDTASVVPLNKKTPTRVLDDYTVNNFENVLKRYSSSNVPLIIVCSPCFRPNDNNEKLSELCKKYKVPFIDLYDTPYFNSHPELFKDRWHLNDDGAHYYTALFFEKLKPYLETLEID